MKVAVYGASGYTGKLVVAELARRGIDMVLVGRDVERLRAAAKRAGAADAELRPAGLDDQDGLVAALRGCQAVISCVAPFVLWGEPVVRAAIAAGCHYVDVTGEQHYIQRIFDTFAADAERAGVTVVPAVTDGGLPGDLIAHLTAELVEPVEELTMAHRNEGGEPSRGSMRTVLANKESFAGGGVDYADGRWRDGAPARRTSMIFPGDSVASPVVKLAAPEVVTIPRHVSLRRVEGVIDADMMAGLGAVTSELVAGAPEGPAEDRRRAVRWTIVADAVGVDGRHARGVVQGADTYGTTAVVAVEGARRLVADGARPGVLAPAQAFDPADFLDSLPGVDWTVRDGEPIRAS